MRIAVVVGTRPEAIKLRPVVELLGRDALVVHTGQHYSPGMTGHLTPDVTLDVCHAGEIARGRQLGHLVTALDDVFRRHQPDAVLVQGDTTSALAGALAANATSIPLVHLEAGLRSFDRAMPEEHNRVLIDHLADLCCAPTPLAHANLLAERISPDRIELTGNTIVEAVAAALPRDHERRAILARLDLADVRYVVATIHRPENTDDPANLAAVLRALIALPVSVLFPVHPRTRKRIAAFQLTALAEGLRLIPPLDYPELLTAAQYAAGLISDSGGLQEEATVLKRPILIVRRSNERPEVEESFGSRTCPGRGINDIMTMWLRHRATVDARLRDIPSPFGDGKASHRLVEAIRSRHQAWTSTSPAGIVSGQVRRTLQNAPY